jgi:hypothetical protein
LVRQIGENGRKAGNDSFGLNIWWNLNILRDTLRIKVGRDGTVSTLYYQDRNIYVFVDYTIGNTVNHWYYTTAETPEPT